MKWLLQTLAVSAPPDSPPGVEMQYLQCCSVSFLHFATAEKHRFLFLSCSDWRNQHWNIFWYNRPSATKRQVIEAAVMPDFYQQSRRNGKYSAWLHFGAFVNCSPQLWAVATQSRGNGALRRRAGALGGAASPSLVATCLIVVYIYFGVQFRSWTYSLIGIKRLVTVTLIEGRI